jgi:predicted ribosomally synthesized peptide with SipW-like signal peptide
MGAQRSERRRRVAVPLILLAAAALTAGGTFSAFSSTTANSNNSYTAGTVYLSDNDANGVLYQATGRAPGDVTTQCLTVSYLGTLASDVKIYTTTALADIGALAPYVDLTITPGTFSAPAPAFPSCGAAGVFTPAAGGAIFTGTLNGFLTTHRSWATGLSTVPSGQTSWTTNDTVVYRVQLTLQDNNAANGGAGGALTTDAHAFTWEAQNQ